MSESPDTLVADSSSKGDEGGNMNEPLKAVDRCDRCGGQAYVRVVLKLSKGGGELLFCAHHAREHVGKLKEVADHIHDETHLLQRHESEPRDAGSTI